MLIYNRLTGAVLFDTDVPHGQRELDKRNLMNADMRNIFLAHWAFRRCNMRGADLSSGELFHCRFAGVDLRAAVLYRADMSGTNCLHSNMSRANLRYANFHASCLKGVDFTGADITGTDFTFAELQGAKLDGAIGLETHQLAPAGDIIGWKKLLNNCVAKLSIGADVPRINALGRRFIRSESAVVLEIVDRFGNPVSTGLGKVRGAEYIVGQTIHAHRGLNTDITKECASGIHFFLTREEAEAYS